MGGVGGRGGVRNRVGITRRARGRAGGTRGRGERAIGRARGGREEDCLKMWKAAAARSKYNSLIHTFNLYRGIFELLF